MSNRGRNSALFQHTHGSWLRIFDWRACSELFLVSIVSSSGYDLLRLELDCAWYFYSANLYTWHYFSVSRLANYHFGGTPYSRAYLWRCVMSYAGEPYHGVSFEWLISQPQTSPRQPHTPPSLIITIIQSLLTTWTTWSRSTLFFFVCSRSLH